MNMAKVRKMTPVSNALGNKTLSSKVKDSLKRISEVNDMMAKRETRWTSLSRKSININLLLESQQEND